ncbi:hypothetical protein CCYN2B_160038 [Capnocytophaga cynodegmi]|uniref:Uncharacterized protein n=2 Tax=Capnocytophaga cynodegmi TaxID=28189 RepID=A0A0B7H1B1_9FLAO|nr:hypothetical protein CCYN2B_160038 [Capnocytophaga cynodegmi]
MKSFGYQNRSTFFLLFIASEYTFILNVFPEVFIALTSKFGNFLPTKDIILFFLKILVQDTIFF